MAIHIVAQRELLPGQQQLLDGPSPDGERVAFFEDDGDCAYFYAVEPGEPHPIRDALLIYVVADVSDRHLPALVKIGWSVDGAKAGLLVNGRLHAAFDFSRRRGISRLAFPAPWPASGWTRPEWTDSAAELFADASAPLQR